MNFSLNIIVVLLFSICIDARILHFSVDKGIFFEKICLSKAASFTPPFTWQYFCSRNKNSHWYTSPTFRGYNKKRLL